MISYYFYHSNSPFSQFHLSPFTTTLPTFFPQTLDSSLPTTHTFHSAEQYMMLSKALLFQDLSSANAILSTDNPKKCKALGRKVANFNEEIWEKHREDVVERANWCKFSSSGELREMLLQTGIRGMVEAAPNDRVWGIGFREGEAEANRDRWGLNLLGKALMKVRGRLSEVEEDKVEEMKSRSKGGVW